MAEDSSISTNTSPTPPATSNPTTLPKNKKLNHALAISNIHPRVPVKLDMKNVLYSTWTELFQIHCRSTKLSLLSMSEKFSGSIRQCRIPGPQQSIGPSICFRSYISIVVLELLSASQVLFPHFTKLVECSFLKNQVSLKRSSNKLHNPPWLQNLSKTPLRPLITLERSSAHLQQWTVHSRDQCLGSILKGAGTSIQQVHIFGKTGAQPGMTPLVQQVGPATSPLIILVHGPILPLHVLIHQTTGLGQRIPTIQLHDLVFLAPS
ncbi:hypothetical protein LIER_39679 [Lithospermum erythrorhizon]|uniref:Uncharacterized protein n=1 Tax=Lithospermum erythrorhizon TaxID=34254 RepID=A0AAV3QLI9_LITER